MARTTHLVVLLVTLTAVRSSQGHARSFTRCQLSRELLRYNFPRSLIPHCAMKDKQQNHPNDIVLALTGNGCHFSLEQYGVCLIEHASNRTTDKVTNHNNSYTSYGLFQIHNKDWCKKGRKGGLCNIKCEDLLNEDLADDVRCAKRIYDRIGFKAWPASFAHCKEKSFPDLSRC